MSESRGQSFSFEVTEAEAGARLDAFLVDRCPDLSRTAIQEDLTADRVRVEGRARPKSFRLKAGLTVTYSPGVRPEIKAVAQDIPLDIVYQDDALLVINKPADMVVHPAPGHPDGTLVNALLWHCRDLQAGSDPLRPGIVHRLDRHTTGLMAVALNDQAHAHLGDQLKDRRMGRAYKALSWGQWKLDEDVLTGDIGRHPRQRQKMAVVEHGGREAVTRYRVLEDFGFAQYCEVNLETGRTHQIRVHFAHNAHPIVGDPLYGDDKRAKGIHNLDRLQANVMVRDASRQMLHAASLHLIHPVSGQEMTFTAALPTDIERVLTGLREG